MEKIGKIVKCKDLEGNTFEVDSSRLSFRPSVYGIIIKGDKILLSKQRKKYDFPGGGVKIDETLEMAIMREIREETGLEVKVGQIVHCETSFFKIPSSGKYVNSILMYFLCEIVGGDLSIDNLDDLEKEHSEMPVWIDLKNVDGIKFISTIDSRKVLQKALQLL